MSRSLRMDPSPGEHLLRFVGDRLKVRLEIDVDHDDTLRAFLRTNLTRGKVARAEVLARTSPRVWGEAPFAGSSLGELIQQIMNNSVKPCKLCCQVLSLQRK